MTININWIKTLREQIVSLLKYIEGMVLLVVLIDI